ncbi:hypothetical protein [Paenibacillus sp. Z6-24]
MKTNINNESASDYLRRKYRVGKFLNQELGSISKNQDLFLRRKLVQVETFENLRSIFSGIEARYESMKQLNLIVTIALFFVTILLGNFSFYLQHTMKQVDWAHEMAMLKLKAKIDLFKTIPVLGEKGYLYNAEISAYTESLNKQSSSYIDLLGDINSIYFLIISVILLYLAFFIFGKWYQYLWVSSIYACVKEAYKQKEKIKTEIDKKAILTNNFE